MNNWKLKLEKKWGTWLAQLVEHMTLDLRIVSLSPMFGCRDYLKINLKKKKKRKEDSINKYETLRHSWDEGELHEALT